HQSEGLNPTLYHYIVGDVTVELARMIERALPNQIMLGDFHAEVADSGGEVSSIDAPAFVQRAAANLHALRGLELSGERIESVKTYLAGTRLATGEFTVRRIAVNDEHGMSRQVYNA